MPDEWDLTDNEIDPWVTEWEAVDRVVAEYLAERIPGVRHVLTDDEARWLDAVADTISQAEEPGEDEIESVSAVMALQHADWLGLALGVLHRGPGSALDPELVQADIARLKEVDGEIEDPEGHLAVLDMALVHLTPPVAGPRCPGRGPASHRTRRVGFAASPAPDLERQRLSRRGPRRPAATLGALLHTGRTCGGPRRR